MGQPLRLACTTLFCLLVLGGCQSHPQAGLSLQQIQVLQQQGFKLTDEGWELGLSSKLLFAIDSERVSASSAERIAKLTRALLDVGIRNVRLEGHTDSMGEAAYNQALSLRRAQAVADIMFEAGMPRENMQTAGLGSERPIKDNKTAMARSENRRVAIIVSAA